MTGTIRSKAAAIAVAITMGGSGCGAAQNKMNPNDPILNAAAVREIAGRTASVNLSDEVAETLPLVTAAGGRPRVVIVFYDETGRPGARKVGPPHHYIEVDPVTGKVIRFARCRPEEIGISMAARIPGVGQDPEVSIEDHYKMRGRFLEISGDVWRLFLTRPEPLPEESRKLVREYWDALSRTTRPEVGAFYSGVAPDFIAWVRAVAAPAIRK